VFTNIIHNFSTAALASLWFGAIVYCIAFISTLKKPGKPAENVYGIAIGLITIQFIINLFLPNPITSPVLLTMPATKWPNYIGYFYFVGCFYFLVKFLFDWYSLQLIGTKPTNKTASASLHLRTQQLAKMLGVAKKIKVIVGKHIVSPFVKGIIRPTIYLPFTYLTSLSSLQLDMILLHELAHIKQYHYLLRLIIAVCKAIVFFNPFVWLLEKKYKLHCEISCDHWVKLFFYNPNQYAETLLHLYKQQANPLPAFALPLLKANAQNETMLRMQALFNKKLAQKFSYKYVIAALVIGFVQLVNTTTQLVSNDITITAQNELPIIFASQKQIAIAKPFEKEIQKSLKDVTQKPIYNAKQIGNTKTINSQTESPAGFTFSYVSQTNNNANVVNEAQLIKLDSTYETLNVLFADVNEENAKAKAAFADSLLRQQYLNNEFIANAQNNIVTMSLVKKPTQANLADSAITSTQEKLDLIKHVLIATNFNNNNWELGKLYYNEIPKTNYQLLILPTEKQSNKFKFEFILRNLQNGMMYNVINNQGNLALVAITKKVI
jgi:beta-lactamase regulating signal transducer with metallopeptidase domain